MDEGVLSAVFDPRRRASIRFEDICKLLRSLGFDERRGKHSQGVIFSFPGIHGSLNLQPEGKEAKAYQIDQVRAYFYKNQDRFPAILEFLR